MAQKQALPSNRSPKSVLLSELRRNLRRTNFQSRESDTTTPRQQDAKVLTSRLDRICPSLVRRQKRSARFIYARLSFPRYAPLACRSGAGTIATWVVEGSETPCPPLRECYLLFPSACIGSPGLYTYVPSLSLTSQHVRSLDQYSLC